MTGPRPPSPTARVAQSCAIHGGVSGLLLLAALRALPWPETWAWMLAYLAGGLVVSTLLLWVGHQWEFTWQARIATHLPWWDRDGNRAAARAFAVGATLGTLAYVLWR